MIAAFSFMLLIMFACGSPPTLAKIENRAAIEIVQPPGGDFSTLEFMNVENHGIYISSVSGYDTQMYFKNTTAQNIACMNENALYVEYAYRPKFLADKENQKLSNVMEGTIFSDTGPIILTNKNKDLIKHLYAVRGHQNKTTL